MGSGGMKRKRRKGRPKAPGQGGEWGTVPVGQDPPLGPYGPMADVAAAGAVARALRGGTPRQRWMAAVLFVVVGLPVLLGVAWGLVNILFG